MNIRKTVKKIAALVAGTTMLGATIMGATALTLGDYPAPFVTNGVWDGKIVVGATAATSDVVGAIDLAASLQAEATTTSEVNVPGAAGTATVIGDSAEFKTGSDVLRLGETIGSVKATFTENDLDALKSGVFDTGESSTPVKQYLKFDNTTAYVNYMENSETDEVTDFLYFPDDSFMFEYHMEFTEGAVADIETGGALDDFESEVLTILGAPFTITSASRGSGNSISLTMLGGQVADTLRDGETKTYTIDGKDYEVTAVFIASDGQTAKLSVNGMLTKELEEGETDVLSADVTIGVQEVLTNQREGIVEFYLGANKLEMTDSDYTGTAYATGTVKVGGKSVDNPYLIIKATNQSSDTELKLNYIKYKVLTDEEIFVPAGKGLREFMSDDANVMLTDTWDVKYPGMMKTGETEIKFNAKSDYGYEFEFENVNGVSYDFPFVTNKDGTYKWGDDDDDFVFAEPNFAAAATSGADNLTFISDDDYFIVSDRATSTTEDKAVTSVMRYQSLSTGESTVTFRNLAGDTITVSYSGTLGSTATGELIVDGASHDFYIGDDNADANEKYALAMDLDGAGGIDNGEIMAVARGGAIIDFGTQAYSNLSNVPGPDALSAAVDINISTPASQFDESADGPASIIVRVNESGTDQMTASVVSPTLLDDPEDDDWARAYTTYGTLVERYVPTSSTGIPEVTIWYPLAMRGAQVFLTAGTVEVHEGSTTAGGAITTTTVNPIAVGLAVLDTDAPALGSENMIVVGGPCVNTVAAALMGNPATCTEGFTPGKAVIKLFADKNALLVAGYSAQDTLGACYVLSDYAKYDLTGSEVEVVVADLNTISVNAVE